MEIRELIEGLAQIRNSYSSPSGTYTKELHILESTLTILEKLEKIEKKYWDLLNELDPDSEEYIIAHKKAHIASAIIKDIGGK